MIVALSADAYAEQQDEAMKVGMSDYLCKPVDEGKLISVLNRYLA